MGNFFSAFSWPPRYVSIISLSVEVVKTVSSYFNSITAYISRNTTIKSFFHTKSKRKSCKKLDLHGCIVCIAVDIKSLFASFLCWKFSWKILVCPMKKRVIHLTLHVFHFLPFLYQPNFGMLLQQIHGLYVRGDCTFSRSRFVGIRYPTSHVKVVEFG